MPTNLYGPGDHYDPVQSHVVAALIMKIHAAKTKGAGTVELWGTGTPRREFLFVDDMAEASRRSHHNDCTGGRVRRHA